MTVAAAESTIESRGRSVLVLQHSPVEGLGSFAEVLRERRIGVCLIDADSSLPCDALDGAGGVIVLGGPMGVNDGALFPRLIAERELLSRALRRRTPILGLCLGSQLLAAALGAPVRRGPRKELGWYEVTLESGALGDRLFSALPSAFTALHWHGDIFDLPRGALPARAQRAHRSPSILLRRVCLGTVVPPRSGRGRDSGDGGGLCR